MSDLADFAPYIRPFAQGCPAFVIEDAVLRAAREFCDRTWAWSFRDTMNISEDIREYVFSDLLHVPADSEVIALQSATGPWKSSGSELSSGNLTKGNWYKITANDDADFTADGAAANTVGLIFQATGENVSLDAGDAVIQVTESIEEYKDFGLDLLSDEFILSSDPSQDFSLVVSLILRPTDSAATIEDWMLGRHGRAIASGALSELLLQPGRDWFNPQLAEYHALQFRKAIAVTKRRRWKGYQNKSLQVKARSFL